MIAFMGLSLCWPVPPAGNLKCPIIMSIALPGVKRPVAKMGKQVWNALNLRELYT